MTRLAEIEARLAAATPGPWGVDHDDEGVFNDTCVVQGNYGWVASGPDSRYPAYDEDTEQGRADAELIAHAPADLAALVEFARRVEEILDDHVSTNEQVFDDLDRAMKQLGGTS